MQTARDLEAPPRPAAKPRPAPASSPQTVSNQPSGTSLPAPTNAVRIAISTNLVVRSDLSAPLAPTAGGSNRLGTFPPVPALPSPGIVFEAQLALARQGISSGALDGILGSQTCAALRTFQRREGLPVTGQLDADTRARLPYVTPSLIHYEIGERDVAELRRLSPTWLGKSLQDRLGYETVLELVAERGQAHPRLIRSLNPQVDWRRVTAGLRVAIPNTLAPPAEGKAAKVRIRLESRTLEAYDDSGRLLAHFPCSIARRIEKRPVGTLQVVVMIRHPSYTFDPRVFPESAEGRRLGRKLHLPPGPNNPVGTAWIGLNRRGYGIHGTPRPEDVGRTESHGCFRLTNWNAERLADLVRVGTPVVVDP